MITVPERRLIGYRKAPMRPRLDEAGLQLLKDLAQSRSLDDIRGYLLQFDSYARTKPMTWLLMLAPARRRLEIFLESGNMCDAPWLFRKKIAKCLREALAEIDLIEVLGPEERAFYEAQPDPIPVWRGCRHGRERGLHWTTNRVLAEEFAQGKRCTNQNPTLVAAEILKQHVLAVFNSRQEDEVVVDYCQLRNLNAMPIEPEEHRPAFLPYS
jgi:hypothetical protein